MQGAVRTPLGFSTDNTALPAYTPGWPDPLERSAISGAGGSCPPEKITELRWIHRATAQLTTAGDLQGWASHDLRGEFGEVHCPVTLVWGDSDIWVPKVLIEESAKLIPGSQMVVIEGSGHFPMLETPERVAELIGDLSGR